MSSKPPNLLFIIADQFRTSALGFRNEDPTFTPTLDALARESKVVTNAVSNYPVCSPHRAMLMTGQHPHRNGVPVNVNSKTGVGLTPGIDTWARVLEEATYRTGYIGKWHLEAVTEEDAIWGEGFREGAVWDAYSPLDRRHGFGFWYSYGAADNHMHPHYWVGDAPREGKITIDKWSVEHETDIAIDFLDSSHEGQPFALVVSYNPPHQPFELAPPTYRSLYEGMTPQELLVRPNVNFESPAGQEALEKAPLYFAAISALDEQLGRLLRGLDATGQRDNTIVIFTSDHGMQLGSHEHMYKNVPWEESMSLPFLIRWPTRIQPGEQSDLLISSVDLAPTLLGLAGLSANIPTAMQGCDLSSFLVGEAEETPSGQAVYYGPPGADGIAGARGLRTLTHKIVVRHDPESFSETGLSAQLFDLKCDPFELTNLSEAQPRILHEMSERLLREIEVNEDPWNLRGPLRHFVAELACNLR